MRKLNILIVLILVGAVLLIGCSLEKEEIKEVGALQFVANGEEFAREGFVSKDNWQISFDQVWVSLAAITGYQSNPPYDAHNDGEIKFEQKANLDKIYTVDIAQGDGPSVVDTLTNVPVGHYNAISWNMVKGNEGPVQGNVLVLIGNAEKDGEVINFNIRLDQEFYVAGGEFIGDERLGIVEAGKEASLEMTFHLDHLFGDSETPADDELNVGALGFEPFAKITEKGQLNIDNQGLQEKLTEAEYTQLVDLLYSLPHVGEGHCYVEKL